MSALSVDDVIAASCDVMRIERDAIERPDRRAPIVFARHMTMLALRRLLDLKLEAIGAVIGNRSVATVLHGIRAAEEAVAASGYARAIYTEIAQRAGSRERGQIAA